MQHYLVEEELDHYRFGWISRREFIRRAALIGVGAAAAAAMAGSVVPGCSPPLRQAGVRRRGPGPDFPHGYPH